MIFTVQPTNVTAAVEVYGGTAACDNYVGGMIGDGADAYALATADKHKKLLIAATRFIERQAWRGTPTVPAVDDTTLSWPRTGIDGVDPTQVPQALLDAVFELVALLADDADVQAQTDSGSNVASVGAGSARISFFNSSSAADGTATVLPPVLNQLIGQYLASADPSIAAAVAGLASGTGAPPSFGRCSRCSADPCSCAGIDERRTWPL